MYKEFAGLYRERKTNTILNVVEVAAQCMEPGKT